jgi:DNA mismatch repair protein MLH3
MTVVSHHHEHRSHNMVIFHHSKFIDRQLPAPPQHEIHEIHGTRVTVRNLFGNLPVRVKQRAVLAEQKHEYDRLWEALKREVTGLLLSWRGQVSLRVRDGDGKTSFSFSNTTRTSNAAQSRSSGLNSTLHVLTQADYISFDDWPAWIPTSASTSAISIKGAISLVPAPSKRVQFICFGIRPLSSESGNNELYDEINRIFAQSNFGIVEDDAGVHEREKIRRQGDKRFKSDGYTNRQLTARKGVDRYPKFYLRISLKRVVTPGRPEEQFFEDESNLQALMEVLGAMITQWLSVHHFRPRKPRLKRNAEGSPFIPTGDHDAESVNEIDQTPHQERSQSLPQATALKTRSSDNHGHQSKRHKPSGIGQTSERAQHRAFAEWSRVKSGKANFFDNLRTGSNIERAPHSNTSQKDLVTSPCDTRPPSRSSVAGSYTKPLPTGSLSGFPISNEPEEPPCSEGRDHDETITWTDPSTKQIFLLNARTGCVLPRHPSIPPTETSVLQQSTLHGYNKLVRLPTKPATSDRLSIQWLSSVLETWDNPVFIPVQKGIQQACHHDHSFDDRDCNRENIFELTVHGIEKAFGGSSGSSISKLSKAGLDSAEIIAQLDKKFILAKMQNTESETETPNRVLVLIDQHAADERVQVEALLSELCAPLPESHAHSGYRSKLGHQSHVFFTLLEKPIQFGISSREQALFTRHAVHFAAWGILFDINPPTGALESQQLVLSVTTLPPGVSERCKADPRVLITFLRSAVWKYADASNTLLPASDNTHSHDERASWVRRLSSCPEGLIDLINSRACRSAIMFNDELSLDKCKDLMQRLSKCVFPFMCAHGRPSMVPLVGLGSVESYNSVDVVSANGKDTGREGHARGNFVEAWKEWVGK